MRLTLLLCTLLPATLAAQASDTLPKTNAIPVTDSVLRLPADRPSDLLTWMAGGGLDRDGAPTWHGTPAAQLDRTTDGIRWASSIRSTGFLHFGATPVILEPDLNTVQSASLDAAGRGPASIDFATRGGGERWALSGTVESAAPIRADGGTGLSRFEAWVGGPLGATFRFRAAGTLMGRQSAPAGISYGDAPYYIPTGIDTTMRYALGPDSIDALVQRFGATTSVPYSPQTTTDLVMRVDGRVGTASAWARWIDSRTSERFFNYVDVANPAQSFGEERLGRDIAVGAALPLSPTLGVEAAVARQFERSERGPITGAAATASSDPWLGLMLDGLDLRYSLDNFAVDADLLVNYRNNTPGSRRSPYNLENTAQYALIDQYRNNAYGLLGFSESGGPVGRLAFYRDDRTLAQAILRWDLGANGSLRIGAEAVRHDVRNYAHALTSQANSDVWIETPHEEAVTAEWTGSAPGWAVRVGARIDRFTTGASRPYLLDTLTGSPTLGQYQYFPRIFSYGAGSSVLRHQVEDDAHTAFAPHLVAEGDLGSGFIGHARVARQVRMPDLRDLLVGLNTDFAITSFNSAYGADMGHEVTDLLEIGVAKQLGPVRLEGTLFNDKLQKRVTLALVSLFDPLTNFNRDVVMQVMRDAGSHRGATLAADWRAASWLRVRGTYTYADTVARTPSFALTAVRPHTLAVTAQVDAPTDGPFTGIGALISYRVMSGAAEGIVLGFSPPYPTRTEGLPAWSSLDLRVAKRIAWGGADLTFYLDARNLLNANDLRRAFNEGDPERSMGNETLVWMGDSAAYAGEALQNSLYDGSGNIDLTFGGAGRGGCGGWVTAGANPSPPNCAYLIGAERNFGDGDGVFSLAEQRAASMSYYRTQFGAGAFNGPPREVRLGARLGF